MNGRYVFEKYEKQIAVLFNTYKYQPLFLKKILKGIIAPKNLKLLLRYFDLKIEAKSIGINIYIADNVLLKNTKLLSIKDNFSIHEFSYVDAAGGIDIGNNVSIAHNCSLISFEHSWDDNEVPIKYNKTLLKQIKIGNDVWIGCGVRILSGTIIEDRVVVAAGSVVKGTLESGFLYGGVPVRKLKKL